jgi:four helix bundle protein
LESFGIYQLACGLFHDFWSDSEILGKDYRGRELVRQQIRSLDSISANIEEGFGRGFGKELPKHLKIARGEARESRGRYSRCSHLLSADLIRQRHSTLDHIIGGLTNNINTIEAKQKRIASASPIRHLSSVTRHSP